MLRRLMLATPNGGDPHWANVVSLLHFDGPDGSTVFTDKTGKIWTTGGNAHISDAQSMFGGAAGAFDGAGDYITTPNDPGFALEAVDFTVECFVRRAVTGAQHYIFSHRPNGSAQQGWEFRINATNTLQIFYTGSSSLISSTTVGASAWHHVAATRKGSTLALWLDGVNVGSTGVANGTAYSGVNFLGQASDGSSSFNGFIDEFRLTKGVARYTSNFTPPTAAFPNN